MLRRRLVMRGPARPQPHAQRHRYTSSATKPQPTSPQAHAKAPSPPHSRIERLNGRLPAFLHKYTRALGHAPLTHVTAFLVLHEMTAIVPLLGLAGYFHYTHWLPPWFAEGAWVASGVERFGRYFRRKGWIRSDEAAEARMEVAARAEGQEGADGELRKVDRAWKVGEGGVRLVVEFATAYAIVKMLVLPRVMLSVWATPWFARWTVIPVLARVKRLLGRSKKGGV